MTSLEILDVPDHSEWSPYQHLPRAVQPVDFSLEPCVRCAAPCCTAIVRLTTVEVLRIAFTLVIDVTEFTEAVAAEPGQALGNGRHLKLNGGKFHIRLQHRAGGCIHAFLPQHGRVRCGIWGLRPGACRVYPHTVILDGEHKISVGDQRLCEVKWLQDDDTRSRMEQDVRLWRADLEEDKRIVARWNRGQRKDRSYAAFVRWLLEEIAPTLGHDPDRLKPPPVRKLGKRLW